MSKTLLKSLGEFVDSFLIFKWILITELTTSLGCLDLGGTIKKTSRYPELLLRKFFLGASFLSFDVFVFKNYHIFTWKTENAPKWILAKKWLKVKPRVIHRLLLGSFWHQKRSWLIIAQTCANSSDLEYFGWFVQNITYGAFFPLSFCWKIQNLY